MTEALKKLAEIRILVARLETVGYIYGSDSAIQKNDVRNKLIQNDTEMLDCIVGEMQIIYDRWNLLASHNIENEKEKIK